MRSIHDNIHYAIQCHELLYLHGHRTIIVVDFNRYLTAFCCYQIGRHLIHAGY